MGYSQNFGFRTCTKDRDQYANSPNSVTVDYQVGSTRYSCELPNGNSHGAMFTCSSSTPLGQCRYSNWIQINLEGDDDLCISHIIMDGVEIDVVDQRFGNDVDTGPNPEGKDKVYKRRYDIDNGVATMSLPVGYETSARVQPECKEPRAYTVYDNKQCEGTGTDILRDFVGTITECEAKCDELDCIGFIRVHSGAPEHEGRCYFRGGEMERPYEYTSDDRDCYVPGQYGTARIVAHCDNHLYVYQKEWTDDWVKVGEESSWPTPWDYSFNVLASTQLRFDCKDKGGIGAFIATMNYNGMQYSTTNPMSNSFFYITNTDVDVNNLKYRSKTSSPWNRATPGLAQDSYWVCRHFVSMFCIVSTQ